MMGSLLTSDSQPGVHEEMLGVSGKKIHHSATKGLFTCVQRSRAILDENAGHEKLNV